MLGQVCVLVQDLGRHGRKRGLSVALPTNGTICWTILDLRWPLRRLQQVHGSSGEVTRRLVSGRQRYERLRPRPRQGHPRLLVLVRAWLLLLRHRRRCRCQMLVSIQRGGLVPRTYSILRTAKVLCILVEAVRRAVILVEGLVLLRRQRPVAEVVALEVLVLIDHVDEADGGRPLHLVRAVQILRRANMNTIEVH